VNADQSLRIAVAFAREAAKSPEARLCMACVDLLAVTGAGITIMAGDTAGPVCVSNPRMAALEDLQYTLGEGPCHDAFHSNAPVHAPRLDGPASTRWPSFVELAQVTGVGAVFAYPLSVNGAKIGVLTLYQEAEGEMSATQHDDSMAIAEVLTETVLSLQDVAPSGTLAPDLDVAVAYRSEIHQASGMLAIQLQIPVAEALLRLRAHAFAEDRTAADVARDIVARRLRLADDRDEPGEVDRSGGGDPGKVGW
jgi:GAF domain-containing protein